MHFRHMMTVGLRMRTIIVTHLYKKSLKLSPAARQARSVGQIVNVSAWMRGGGRGRRGKDVLRVSKPVFNLHLIHVFVCVCFPFPLVTQMMSTDTSKVDMFCGYLHFLWSFAGQIVVAVALLIRAIGPPALAGLAIMLLMVPFQGVIMRRLQQLRKATVKYTDRRVKLMNEILQGIRVIKVYACQTDTRSPVLPCSRTDDGWATAVPCSTGARALTLFSVVWLCAATSFVFSVLSPQGRAASSRN